MKEIQAIRRLVSDALHIGEPETEGPLTLTPVFGGSPAEEYAPGEEAIAAGTLTISEVSTGSVPQLLAINDGGVPVLVLDGEHLEGAMQDRVLNTTVLLPAMAKTVIPVSCVEHGRWHYEGGDTFAPSRDFSYSRLRSRNVESVTASLRAGNGHTSDQGAIWDDVAAKHDELSVEQSATGAMKDAFELSRSSIGKLTRAFSKPHADQTGVIASVAGKAVALDAFDRPETLRKLWPRLISGYAMDAVGAQEKAIDLESAQQLLSAPREGEITAHDAIGLGTDLAITSREIVGKALLWTEATVHLALFSRPADGETDGPGIQRSRIDSPQRRRSSINRIN